jgi:hypothetical protein
VETGRLKRSVAKDFQIPFYFSDILQQGTTGWHNKRLINTVTENGIHSTDLTHGPSVCVDGRSFCKICKTLSSLKNWKGREEGKDPGKDGKRM